MKTDAAQRASNLAKVSFLLGFSLGSFGMGSLVEAEEEEALGELETVIVESPDPAPAAAPRPVTPVPRPVIVDQVVETATRTETPIDETIVTVGVISEEEILQISPLSFDDLIRKVPNVETLGGPRYLGEQLIIRGEGGNAVTVRIDDARQNFVSGHAGQRFFIETDFLSEAEILRGAGSFLYGSGSAGVVNLSTLDPVDVLNDSGVMGLRIRNAYNTNSKEWANSVVGAVAGEGFEFLIGASDRFSRNITLADDVELPNSAIERDSTLTKMTWTPNDEHRFEFGFSTYESLDQGGANPQANVSATGNPGVGREIDYQQFTATHLFNPIDNDLINTRTTFYYNETTQVRNYTATMGSNVNRTNVHALEVFGIDFTNVAEFSTGGLDHELVFGIDYFEESQDGTETRDTFFVPGAAGNPGNRPDAESENIGIFLVDEIDITDTLSINAGLRYDSNSSNRVIGNGLSQSNNGLSPHIGFEVDVTENILVFGRYSKAFTSPTLNDFYQDGSHFGVVPNDPFVQVTPPRFVPPFGPFIPGQFQFNYFEEVFVPNTSLQPEKSDNFELGVHYENDDFMGGKVSSRLTGFYKSGENTFDSEIVGFGVVDNFNGFANPPGTVMPGFNVNGTLTQAFRQTVNRAETEIKGVEFTFDYDADVWFASVAAGTVRGEDTMTGLNLNSTTGDQLALTLGIRPMENVELGAYGIWNGGREDLVNDPFSKTSAYDIYGIFATYQANEDWTLRFGVDNLFDQAYERTNILQQEPGRNVVFSSTIRW